MDKETIKTIAITLVIIMIFCGGYTLGMSKKINISVDVGTSQQDNNYSAPTTSTSVASTTQVTTTPQSTQSTTQDITNSPDIKPTVTQPSVSIESATMSTEEIVALYNESVNKVKSEATNLTRNYKHLSIPEDQLELPTAIQGIASTAISTFVKDNNEPQSWTKKEDMQIIFPVGKTDYSSKLTADMVESASCTDNGDSYKVEIKLYDDKLTSPEKGQGYAGVFNTTTASTFTEINIPTVTFNQVDINGTDGSISCTIDKATKRVTEITFANTDIMKLNVKVAFSTVDAKMAMIQEENFTIQY